MAVKFFFPVFILSAFSCLGQEEFFHPLNSNPVLIIKAAEEKANIESRNFSSNIIVSLPFIDDFSKPGVYPNAVLWEDSAVYINTDFAIAPPTIGVATFEGLNKSGYPYDFSVGQLTSAYADKLTSKPIDLALPSTDTTVYFSFFYQAQGRGNSPEAKDSLSLEFKDPSGIWKKVWSKAGYVTFGTADTNFHPVIIRVQPTYYYSGFQFRFRNKATLSGSVDHWHIDYVYLDRSRQYNDTIMEDVGFAYRAPSLLKNYEAMPYKHYTVSELKSDMSLFIRNNDISTTSNKYKYTVYDNMSTVLYAAAESNANIPSFYNAGYQTDPSQAKPALGYTIPILSDTASFVIEHVTKSGLAFELSTSNDSIIHRQQFSNYFAYDDGTAELSYGPGGSNPAYLACQFNLAVSDTLRAVQMYFNPVLKDERSAGFQITVWNNNSGSPGTVIYKGSVTFPKYDQLGPNVFHTYPVDSLILSPGSYYIGWTQISPDILNIGFDMNKNSQSKIFYNVGTGWQHPTEKGSLMLRPVFGRKSLITGMEDISNKNKLQINIYPNPAAEKIYISLKDKVTEVVIYDRLGKIVLRTNVISSGVDVSGLANGLYFVRISDLQKNTFTSKLIISK